MAGMGTDMVLVERSDVPPTDGNPQHGRHKKHLSELGIYDGVQIEIVNMEKERISNRPQWVSPIECGTVDLT